MKFPNLSFPSLVIRRGKILDILKSTEYLESIKAQPQILDSDLEKKEAVIVHRQEFFFRG